MKALLPTLSLFFVTILLYTSFSAPLLILIIFFWSLVTIGICIVKVHEVLHGIFTFIQCMEATENILIVGLRSDEGY